MIAGIDLGGSLVRIAVATPDGSIVGIAKGATRELGGPAGMVAWSRENAERLADGGSIDVVGIGVPGPSDPHTGVLVNKLESMYRSDDRFSRHTRVFDEGAGVK